jgi:hypothetical protein
MNAPQNKSEAESATDDAQLGTPTPEQVEELDADEAEFRAIRQDLPGVKGAGGAGIVAISVGKIPTKNEFFRTHRDWRPIVPVVDHEVGIEKQFFAVTADMVANLAAIGITVTNHVLISPSPRAVASASFRCGRPLVMASKTNILAPRKSVSYAG